MKLVIVESSSKISSYLGYDYIIKASIGYIQEKINELEIKNTADFSELYDELNYEDNNVEDIITRQTSKFFENNNIDNKFNDEYLEL
jgi:DNA topoisomerase IA